tara:strand:- start:1453 stop:1656 length:204 start_codon:yes stop_codon:yes gene_type:complete
VVVKRYEPIYIDSVPIEFMAVIFIVPIVSPKKTQIVDGEQSGDISMVAYWNSFDPHGNEVRIMKSDF